MQNVQTFSTHTEDNRLEAVGVADPVLGPLQRPVLYSLDIQARFVYFSNLLAVALDLLRFNASLLAKISRKSKR